MTREPTPWVSRFIPIDNALTFDWRATRRYPRSKSLTGSKLNYKSKKILYKFFLFPFMKFLSAGKINYKKNWSCVTNSKNKFSAKF